MKGENAWKLLDFNVSKLVLTLMPAVASESGHSTLCISQLVQLPRIQQLITWRWMSPSHLSPAHIIQSDLSRPRCILKLKQNWKVPEKTLANCSAISHYSKPPTTSMITVPSGQSFILCSIFDHYQVTAVSQSARHKSCYCCLQELMLAFVTTFKGMNHFNFVSLSSWKPTLILARRKNSWCEELETQKFGHTLGIRFLAALKYFFPLPVLRKLLWCSVSNWDGCVWKDCSWLTPRSLGGSDVPVLWVCVGWELDHPVSVFAPLKMVELG